MGKMAEMEGMERGESQDSLVYKAPMVSQGLKDL